MNSEDGEEVKMFKEAYFKILCRDLPRELTKSTAIWWKEAVNLVFRDCEEKCFKYIWSN